MMKINLWVLINNEAAAIIKAIEKGEIKTHKEYHDYTEAVYNWRTSDAIKSIVNVYLGINNIEMPWENDVKETAE